MGDSMRSRFPSRGETAIGIHGREVVTIDGCKSSVTLRNYTSAEKLTTQGDGEGSECYRRHLNEATVRSGGLDRMQKVDKVFAGRPTIFGLVDPVSRIGGVI